MDPFGLQALPQHLLIRDFFLPEAERALNLSESKEVDLWKHSPVLISSHDKTRQSGHGLDNDILLAEIWPNAHLQYIKCNIAQSYLFHQQRCGRRCYRLYCNKL